MDERCNTRRYFGQIARFAPKWVVFWSGASQIGQQAVAQLTQIPWGHNLVIVSKCSSTDEGLYYIKNTVSYGWSRSVLTHQIESKLWQREGKALSNFSKALPAPQPDLAHQTLKDPYVFDFLRLAKDYDETELELGLVEHITQFLLELGAGFAYIGRQVPLQVGEREFFIDLLFYHTRLHCYVVVELICDAPHNQFICYAVSYVLLNIKAHYLSESIIFYVT